MKLKSTVASVAAFVMTITGAGLLSAQSSDAAAGSDHLNGNESLSANQWIDSANGSFRLIMQSDGNTVLFVKATGTVLWSSHTAGYAGAMLTMQGDGNVVFYKGGNHFALKASNTVGPVNTTYLAVQNDGNVVAIRTNVGAVWATGTDGGRVAATPTGARLCAQAGYGAGFRYDDTTSTLRTAVAVGLAESGCNPNAVNHNTNGSTDTGLWQINSVHKQWTQQQLFDPNVNASAAWSISNHGASFTPWTTYNSGKYNSYLNAASTAIRQL